MINLRTHEQLKDADGDDNDHYWARHSSPPVNRTLMVDTLTSSTDKVAIEPDIFWEELFEELRVKCGLVFDDAAASLKTLNAD